MASPSEITKTLEEKLAELDKKATAVEDLAVQVKANEKKLLDMSNSTLSYIAQLRAKHRDNSMSSVTLAKKLEETISNIEKKLKEEPGKSSIDKTIEDLQKILQDDKTSSASKKSESASDSESSSTEKKEDKGFIDKTLSAINDMVTGTDEKDKKDKKDKAGEEDKADEEDKESTGESSPPKPAAAIVEEEKAKDQLSAPLAKKSGMDEAIEELEKRQQPPSIEKDTMTGGYRYSKRGKVNKSKSHTVKSSGFKKSKKSTKSSKLSSKTRTTGRGLKKKTIRRRHRVKSHFTKTRKHRH